MTITYDFDGYSFSYVPNNDDLAKGLATLMIKNAGALASATNTEIVKKIIINHDFIYDDEIMEYYYDNLKDYFWSKARRTFDRGIDT